jgi:hypothetical protein
LWASDADTDKIQSSQRRGVLVDSSRNVYIADALSHRIQKFAPEGKFLTEWGEFGDGPGQLNVPPGIPVDAAGNVYVSDSHNHHFQNSLPWLSAMITNKMPLPASVSSPMPGACQLGSFGATALKLFGQAVAGWHLHLSLCFVVVPGPQNAEIVVPSQEQATPWVDSETTAACKF